MAWDHLIQTVRLAADEAGHRLHPSEPVPAEQFGIEPDLIRR
jgi:hypothetical protein